MPINILLTAEQLSRCFSELIGVARIFSVQLKVHSRHHLHHRDNHADKLLKGSLSFLKLAAVSRKFHSSLKKWKNEKKIYKVSKKLETVFFSKDLKSSIFKFNEMISIQFEQFLFRGIKMKMIAGTSGQRQFRDLEVRHSRRVTDLFDIFDGFGA